MFGISRARDKLIAVVDITSASAGVAILARTNTLQYIASARMELPFGERTSDALASGVLQELAIAGQKVLADLGESEWKGRSIGTVFCVVGAPWARTFCVNAESKFTTETTITDAAISTLAQQALQEQKDIDRGNVLEASVMRVMLNGYTTGSPIGKKAHKIEIVALISDCNADIKSGAQDAIAKLFPGASVAWRSSARSALSIVRELEHIDTCLVVEVSDEATNMIILRKGVIEDQASLPEGTRSIATAFAAGKPQVETLALLDMMEHDQSDSGAGNDLKQSMARAEPELTRVFGEALAKLVAVRRLPNDLMLLAPAHLSPWLTRFFSRIDFAQFTTTMQPFSVTPLTPGEILGLPTTVNGNANTNASIVDDAGLSIACTLVNIESHA